MKREMRLRILKTVSLINFSLCTSSNENCTTSIPFSGWQGGAMVAETVMVEQMLIRDKLRDHLVLTVLVL